LLENRQQFHARIEIQAESIYISMFLEKQNVFVMSLNGNNINRLGEIKVK